MSIDNTRSILKQITNKETDYHTHRLGARQNFYADLSSGTKSRDERVCVFVSLSASISQKLYVQSSPIFYMLPTAVAQTSTGGVAICYVLPVIRRSSCLRIMNMNRRCEKKRILNVTRQRHTDLTSGNY